MGRHVAGLGIGLVAFGLDQTRAAFAKPTLTARALARGTRVVFGAGTSLLPEARSRLSGGPTTFRTGSGNKVRQTCLGKRQHAVTPLVCSRIAGAPLMRLSVQFPNWMPAFWAARMNASWIAPPIP